MEPADNTGDWKEGLAERVLLMTVGMWITCTGIALSAVAGLGTTPQATLPYVLSLGTPMSLGTWTLAISLVLLAVQCVILRGRNRGMLLLQIPTMLLFSLFSDAALWVIEQMVSPGNYAESWLLCLLGVLALAFGTTLAVKANLGFAPADGIVRVIAWKRRSEFGSVKLGFDILMVSLAAACSLMMFAGFQGVREGTIVAMLLIGPLVRVMSRWMHAEHHHRHQEAVSENV